MVDGCWLLVLVLVVVVVVVVVDDVTYQFKSACSQHTI